MQTLLLKPRNKADYRLFVDLAKRLNVSYQSETIEVAEKKVAKIQFLDNLEGSIEQVNQHSRGEIELPTLNEFLNGL
jgi:hypothetical protein